MQSTPDGSGVRRGASQPASSDGKTHKRTGDARGPSNLLESLNPGQTFFARVASQFERADLMNPDKLNRMMRGAVDVLLAQEFSELSPTQRRRLAAWMKNDPLVRERMIKALGGNPELIEQGRQRKAFVCRSS